MRISLVASACFLAICFAGCSRHPARLLTQQEAGNANEALSIPQQVRLPIARFPTSKLEIEAPGGSKGSERIDFSKCTRELTSPPQSTWQRMGLGVDHVVYDARIEYLGRSAKGDRYKITIRQPYQDGETNQEAVPIIYDYEIDYQGQELKVFEISGVTFTMKG